MITDPYASLGVDYAHVRRADPRIELHITAALGPARTVVNVGAGTGSYEPRDRVVTAVEPSATMIAQREPGTATVVQGFAEDLPFPDNAFDVGLAVLTVHHWQDPERGLAEMRRVSHRQVVLTWDPQVMSRMWFVADYLPEIARAEQRMATVAAIAAAFPSTVVPVPVPSDCTDGFLAAYWQRPHAYLDPILRAGASAFSRLPEATVDAAVARLGADLTSGRWHERYAWLLERETFDAGYRLVVSA